MLDFEPFRREEIDAHALAAGLAHDDLIALTNEMCDLQLAAIADATDEDVVFMPDDPVANDAFAGDEADAGLAWTLGHVVVHTTASAEESASFALTLARGLSVEGRSRYETPWQEATTVAFARARIEESRRMRLAMLAAWPDRAHLDNTYTPYRAWGPLNAISRVVAGLSHDDSHLGQMRAIMAQATAARR